ncbi:hypothetical protein H4V96_002648 [Janthinobacterium sp. CG_23.4]|nr:hypothetical protein [Janthinobacterium sp. CG_23.4]
MMKSQNLKTEAYHALRPANRRTCQLCSVLLRLRLPGSKDLHRQGRINDAKGQQPGDRLLAPRMRRSAYAAPKNHVHHLIN